MRDDEYLNILDYGTPTGTITVRSHPQDVIDVDPEVIARMKAKLKGEDLSSIYTQSERIFDEVTLLREKKKLKKIFSSESDLRVAFSSIKNIRQAMDELTFEGVDRALLAEYALMRSGEENVDEFDFYRSFLFGTEIISKKSRVKHLSIDSRFLLVVEDYVSKHFEILKITREAIQMSPALVSLFLDRKLVSIFEAFLCEFYGVKL